MNAFDQLKKDAQTAVQSQLQTEKSWIKSNRGWLIAIVVAFALGLIIPHL